MKRALVVSFFAAFGLAAIACSNTPEGLPDSSRSADKKDKDSDSEKETTTKKNDTKTNPGPVQTTTPPATNNNKPPATTPNPNDCATAETADACNKCCNQQNNPLKNSVCNVGGSPCQIACGPSLCTNGKADLQCGFCLLSQGGGADDGNGGNGGNPEDFDLGAIFGGGALQGCLSQCKGKNP